MARFRTNDPIEPMDLANMRENGVRSLWVQCNQCRQHTTVMNVDHLPGDLTQERSSVWSRNCNSALERGRSGAASPRRSGGRRATCTAGVSGRPGRPSGETGSTRLRVARPDSFRSTSGNWQEKAPMNRGQVMGLETSKSLPQRLIWLVA
jgi:hypothetical protein